MKAKATLLKPTPAIRFQNEPARGGTSRRFVGQNPPRGAQIDVALTAKAEKAALKVTDYDGATVYSASVPTDPGLHRLTWSLTRPAPQRPGPRPTGLAGLFGGRGRGFPAAPGTYRVVLTVDGQESSQPLKVEPDPAYPDAPEITEETLEATNADRDADMDDDEEPRRVIDID
jgi:hypothetical protein